MSRLLFVVHGMGAHGANWCGDVLGTLNRAAARYEGFGEGDPFVTGAPAAHQVQVVPVGYDSVFDAWREELNGSVEALQAFFVGGRITFPEADGVLRWLHTAPDDERQFFWSHVVDVLLYRFTLKAGEVRVRVMQQIATVLRDAMQDGTVVEASVLAHSLGTSVAHDSLALLGTTPLEGSEAFMKPRLFKNVFMLANVSRILQSPTLGVYESVVRPASADPKGYVDAYFNVRHCLDPIPAVRPFEPSAWGSRYVSIDTLNHLKQFNVHDFCHYLDAPQVHVPLFNNLFGLVVRGAEKRAAEAQFESEAGLPCPEQVALFKKRIEAMIGLLRSGATPPQLLVAASQFLALVREVRDACN